MEACKKVDSSVDATPTRTSEAVQGVSTQAGFFRKAEIHQRDQIKE